MPPPKLAGDAPGLNILEPVEVGLLPALRHKLGLTVAHGVDCRPGERLGVDVPLIGEPRLNDRVRPVAVRNGVGVGFNPRQKAGKRHHLDDPEPRDETVLAVDGGDEPRVIVIALQPFEEVEIVLEDHPPLRIEDIDRANTLGLVALADFEIVEVVRRSDLDRARALFRI